MAETLIQSKDLSILSRNLLIAAGLTPDAAALVEDNLVEANLKGVDSHGVVRLDPYLAGILNGYINITPDVRVINETDSVALVDGDNGLGQVVAHQAVSLAIRKAKNSGVGVVAVQNSNHFGTAGYYALKFTDEDMIGLVLSNAPPTMAPWGGVTPLFGTNPMAWAAPSGMDYPVFLDIASSVVSRGRIKLAADRNEEIPLGWAMSPEGYPTTDPKIAMEGTVLPFGEHKGYGITFFIDILCGVLSGGAFSIHLKQIPGYGGTTGKTGICHFFLGIDISRFISLEQFLENMRSLIELIKNSRPRQGIEEVFLPGEIEFKERDKRMRSGIPLQEEEVRMLENLAFKLKVNCPWH
jgi:LDH2 family malate/lactate/ureidoglycolate dehydrogenase